MHRPYYYSYGLNETNRGKINDRRIKTWRKAFVSFLRNLTRQNGYFELCKQSFKNEKQNNGIIIAQMCKY